MTMADNKKQSNNRYIEKGHKKDAFAKQNRRVNGHVVFGFFVFLVLLIYLLFVILSFTFDKKTSYTFAEFGQIVESETFDGLIIRNERVVKAMEDGTAHYFTLEGSKVKKNATICLVDSNHVLDGYSSTTFEDNNFTISSMTSDEKVFLNDQFKQYIEQKQLSDFNYIYEGSKTLKNTIGEIYSAAHMVEKQNLLNTINSNENSNDISEYGAPITGIASYYLDGLENLNIANYSLLDLINNEAQINYALKTDVNAGDSLFKIVDNYEWYMVSEISQVFADYIANEIEDNKNYITVQFHQKGITADGTVRNVIKENDHYYVEFTFDRYLEQFINDRFVSYTITYKNYEGLKIPNSSVLTKEFVSVPRNTMVNSNGREGVFIEVIGEDIQQKFIPINFYYADEANIYIPLSDELSLNDVLIYQDNGIDSTYPLSSGELQSHEGVYVINKGYAGFALIETLTYNDDYRIVETNTLDGVMMYDRIASDASTIEDNELIN